MSKPVSWENKKNNLKCHLLNSLPRMLGINTKLDFHFDICYKDIFRDPDSVVRMLPLGER